jgi:ribosomal protein S18 acetylase RimI-like enzyme
LYVAVDHQGEGIGRRLLELAKSRSLGLLELYTFQVNEKAVAFYLANGFEIVDGSDGSRNEELEPDYRLSWARKSQ